MSDGTKSTDQDLTFPKLLAIEKQLEVLGFPMMPDPRTPRGLAFFTPRLKFSVELPEPDFFDSLRLSYRYALPKPEFMGIFYTGTGRPFYLDDPALGEALLEEALELRSIVMKSIRKRERRARIKAENARRKRRR